MKKTPHPKRLKKSERQCVNCAILECHARKNCVDNALRVKKK